MRRFFIVLIILLSCYTSFAQKIGNRTRIVNDTLFIDDFELNKVFYKTLFRTKKSNLFKTFLQSYHIEAEDTYFNTAFETEFTGPPYYIYITNQTDTLIYIWEWIYDKKLKGPWSMQKTFSLVYGNVSSNATYLKCVKKSKLQLIRSKGLMLKYLKPNSTSIDNIQTIILNIKPDKPSGYISTISLNYNDEKLVNIKFEDHDY